MLSIKGKLLIVALLVAAVFLTGRIRLRLDDITEPFRNDFREMLYLPRGNGLKVIACGFDTPLADALFIKSLIYYAESFQAKDKSDRRTYTYELFDVITDLNPRFARAYQVGGLFLSSSAALEANRHGVALLDKGVKVFDGIEASGEKVRGDPRWLYHLLIANTYEVNIQARLRAQNDAVGASEARRAAGEEFVRAAKSPGAPEYVIDAATGYESTQRGNGRVEDSIKATLGVWHELYAQAEARGDKEIMADLQQRIERTEKRIAEIDQTRELERLLGLAGREYLARHGKAPGEAADLVRERLIGGMPRTPLASDDMPDTWLALPDGTFKSELLSTMERESHLELLFDAVLAYRRAMGRLPPNLQTLVDEKYIADIPAPPLAGLGQVYHYNPASGVTEARRPLGPALPPDRR